MKITYKGDYALKALLDLALNYEKGLLTINDVAKHIDAPVKFLEQVLLDLKKGGFVESKRGNVGGYQLAKDPAEITLGQVIRYIDGPIEPIGCVEKGYSNCTDLRRCVFKNIWQKVALATSGIIDKINFADLVSQIDKKQDAPIYTI
ncbi:MAG TPA: Rrf2 family transcriptional regulator [Candidatus Omnitrophota bacterium]|nr:Rrf2 family transcriptional regulator [Candidatus Omnitrophota bacterium]